MLCFLCQHGESLLADKQSVKKSTELVHKFDKIVHQFENGGDKSVGRRTWFNDSLSSPICQQCFSKLKSVTISHSAVYKVEARVRRCQEALLLEMKNLQFSLDKLYMEMEAVGTIINCSKQGTGINDEDVIVANYRSQMLKAISGLMGFRNKLREKTGISLENTDQNFVAKIKSELRNDHNSFSDNDEHEQPVDEFETSADLQPLNDWKGDTNDDNLVDPQKPVPISTTARNTRAKRKVVTKSALPRVKKSAPEPSSELKLIKEESDEEEEGVNFEVDPADMNSEEDSESMHSDEEQQTNKQGRQGRPKIQQTCDLCGIKLTASEILEHVQGHVGDYAMKCPNDNCPQMYSTHFLYRRHVSRSRICKQAIGNNNQEFSCATCGFKGNTYCQLKVHLDKFHERGPHKMFKCPIPSCDKSFCVRQSVNFHLSIHVYSDKSLQTCDHCHKRIKTEEMGEHLKSEHDAEEIITCQQCPYSFISRASLLEHLAVHCHKEGVFCDMCNDNVKYTRHMYLREHYRVAHDVKGDKYVCKHCSKEFWKRESLVQHMLIKHSKDKEKPKEKKRWPCDTCFGKVDFWSESALIAHKISAHGDTPFTCTLCDATFTNKVDFIRHQKEHAGIPVEFVCEVTGCGKVFKKKENLDKHVSTIHLGSKDHVCDLCGKSFTNNLQFKQHHNVVHLGLRPFKCQVCGECFGARTTLRNHKRIHTGERPFVCELCGQTFRHKEVLKRHVVAHKKKGTDFKPNGPMKQIRKRKAQ